MDLERELSLSIFRDIIKMAELELQVRKILDKPVLTQEEAELIDMLCDIVE